MRLTRLELSGFKSFAGAVELPFEAGVTAIVGPNGCGKSNISDAVRWVLGEQSPRLLRGGKMEDVIFQGSTGRRPVNVAEVSLVFDNSDGTLPIAYQEVVVTRRLSRSGQSEYLLNRSAVRLRDVQDLLRGTGLGADAAVVMEARMIEALLSEKAEERRALFEEAAGIGLYRDRKTSTERRLEETAADLARLEDLVSEVQTQVRSLARQRGKAERYGKMIDERFGVALTLVRRELEDFDLTLGGLGQRAEQLAAALPGERARLEGAEREREAGVQARHTAEARRTEVERRLADAKLETGRLEGDLALAAERLRNAGQRRAAAAQRREQEDARALQAERERAAAAAECDAAERDLASVGQELAGRTTLEQEGRDRLLAQRAAVRELEEDLQRQAEAFRALEGERAALERERAELGQQLADASQERARRAETEWAATATVGTRAQEAAGLARAAGQAAAGLEQARRRVAELKEQETHGRAARRQAEGALAQVTARRDALAELERERVGLAPAAQALLKERARFGDAVIGPLSDFVRTSRRDAVLAEQLLGEWLHAVLVRDAAAVETIRRWHEQAQPGPLVLLPSVPGPRLAADGPCDGPTAPCFWRDPRRRAGARSNAAPSSKPSRKRCEKRRRSGAAPPPRWSERSPSLPRPRPRSRPRVKGRSGPANRSSRLARRRTMPSAPPPTPSARRPTRPLRSSGCRRGWPKWKPGSRHCTRTSSGMKSSASASTSGWVESAPGWSTSRGSRKQRGSNGCGGRWMRPRSRRGSARRASAPAAPRRKPTRRDAIPRRWPKR